MNQNNQTIQGRFLGAGAVKTVGQNNAKLRNFWVDITDNPAYPNTPEFQLFGDKVILVDNLKKGEMIVVNYNLNGRKYTNAEGKEGVITNLQCWKIQKVTIESAATANIPAETIAAANQVDDLPF
jgi:hypothetical protein